MEDSAVRALFRDSTIFVTGGTGFLGKLLLEKILRACPDVKTIYLLMRPKKGKEEAERFAELFDGPVFDSMKKICPEYINKVKFVSGDCGSIGLGLNDEDIKLLCQEVNIVYHIAATVRFDEKIKTAVNINVRGTQQLLSLSKKMTHLKSFVHVSTSYANCPVRHIGEEFYPPALSCDEAVHLVDLLQEDVLNAITPTLLGKWPNTYTFTKAIAEDTVREFGKNLPVTIVRPAVVICTAREPVSGWINNIYGPTGVVVGAGIGLLRTMHCDPEVLAEVVPADLVINMMIVAAWNVATTHKLEPQLEDNNTTTGQEKKVENIPILNYVSSTQNPISWGQYMKLNECGTNYPSVKVMWYYYFQLNKNRMIHNIYAIFLHFLPALIIDTVAKLIGKEPILWNAYKKIHRFVDVISYFSTQQWKFTNYNVQAMWNRMSPVDQQLFDFNIAGLDWKTVFESGMQGLRIHLAQDAPDTLEAARKRYKRLKIAHYTLVYALRFIFLSLITWIIYNLVL